MNLIKNIFLAAATLLVLFMIMEGVLRLLPVNAGFRTHPVNDAAPIAHYQPNRTYIWSRFPDFSMRNRIHANNLGFINNQDYTADDPRPVIAVIGDSFVEAAMVPYDQTVQGKLAAGLSPRYRVYSFAMSGAPLSQYLAYAQYARDTFRPEKMVIVIVSNDFDESLLKYKNSPGFHYFKPDADGKLNLQRIDFAPSYLRRILRHSRLCMYLVNNLQIQHTIAQLFAEKTGPSVGQTKAEASKERLHDSRMAVDTFLRLLPEYAGLARNDLILAVDALRPHIYTAEGREEAKGSYADLMRRYLLQRATKEGYLAIDLTKPFLEDYATAGKPFEFKKDGHWNARGHGVVAKTLLPLLDGQ